MEHRKWGKIGHFHNVVAELERRREFAERLPVITYRAKVKIHGTNAGIQFDGHGGVVAQSRTRLITPEDDNHGFAKWVSSVDWPAYCSPMTIHGEWCGGKIQRGVAISKAPQTFAVFAVEMWAIITDPLSIEHISRQNLLTSDRAKVLPWHGNPITIDFNDQDSVKSAEEEINAMVEAVDACDPWALSEFGVEGPGEGVVMFPVSCPYDVGLSFKAKGASHSVRREHRVRAQIDPGAVADIVSMFVTEPRLEQGVDAVGGFDIRKTGDFLKWMGGDIKSESADDLEASSLEWKDVAKHINRAVRDWWIARVN